LTVIAIFAAVSLVFFFVMVLRSKNRLRQEAIKQENFHQSESR
jgi:uncharacterized membrane protein